LGIHLLLINNARRFGRYGLRPRVRFDGTTTFKGEAPTTATCNWTFYGGTGKLRGLTGKGTCTGTFDATGAAVFDVVGEYSIAAAKTK
jgi:hypothetical protein